MIMTAKKFTIVAASAAAMMTGAIASAQSFGGLPTVTPQSQKERAARADADRDQDRRGTKAPAYVVVDKGGPQGGRDRNVYSSINEALDAVAWGGVVVVMPGIYNENVVLRRSVSLQGDRGDGANVIIRPKDESKSCLAFKPKRFNDHAMVSNITFQLGRNGMAQNAHSNGLEEPCVDVEGGVFTLIESTIDGNNSLGRDLVNIAGGTVLLEKNRVTGGKLGIRVEQDHALWDRTLLVDNIVSDNTEAGIHLAGVSSMLATGNLINDNGTGLEYTGSGAATLVGNKILNNHGHGIDLQRDGRQVLARLNQIWSNGNSGINIVNTSGLIEDNDIDGNTNYEISVEQSAHLATVPTIINDVSINKPSPRRGGWGINTPKGR